jgi:hypothetical protein
MSPVALWCRHELLCRTTHTIVKYQCRTPCDPSLASTDPEALPVDSLQKALPSLAMVSIGRASRLELNA